MTDDMDEFDQDQFDSPREPERKPGVQGVRQSLTEAWRTKPLFKLLVIMAGVAFAMAGALGSFSGGAEKDIAQIGRAPELNEPPGKSASPFFIEQNKQANAQRVNEALQDGGSAIPTPVGKNIDLSELTDKNRKDPLLEFRAETERLKQEMRAEQKQNAQQVQLLQQQMKQKKISEDDSLARAMQKQMQDLMQSWVPSRMKTIAGMAPSTETQSSAATATGGAQMASVDQNLLNKKEVNKAIIPAGVVNYAQLLTEANSDIPGPILAQVLSGPLAGGRAIGQFQVMNDYLVLTFNRISYKGEDYPVTILALDPDTTLGGMATEVDHRYFTRLLLPAAAAFTSAFGDALSEGSSETTVSGDTVIVTQAEKGYKDALYDGLGQVGQTMSQFFQAEANKTKVLVRVAVGTPMGLFFTQPVYKPGTTEAIAQTEQTTSSALSARELLARRYQSMRDSASGFQSGMTETSLYPSAGYSTTGTYAPSYSTTGTYAPSTMRSVPASGGLKSGTTTIYP